MAMLTVYCDDSGTHKNSRVAVVAGYVSKIAQWDRFNMEWKQVLKEFGILKIHRAELESFQGAFKRWEPQRRNMFLQRLQSIIRRRTIFPVGTAVNKDDFEAVTVNPSFS